MKTTVLKPTEIEISHIELALPVWYDEEEIPNDFPFRKGDLWTVLVEMDTGKILNWPKGRAAKIHLTVKDGGKYTLYGPDREVLAKRDGDYVPHDVVPGQYGDTVELDIAECGTIRNWPRQPDVTVFFAQQD